MIVFCHGKAFAVEVLNEKNGSVYSLKYFESCMEKIKEDTSENEVNILVKRSRSLFYTRTSGKVNFRELNFSLKLNE